MTNSELTRQRRHYNGVRERLVRSDEGRRRSIAMVELENEVAGLASDNAAKARRIAVLEADLADVQARLLAQAQMLLSERSTGEAEDGRNGGGPSIETIVASVLADFPGVTWDDIISVRRERRLVKPRHACMRAVYENRRDLSLPRIGRIFHRDHTTVLAAVRAVPDGHASPTG